MNGEHTISTPPSRRLRLAWDWYTDLGFGSWLIAGGVLIVTVLVIAVIVGHFDSADTSCATAKNYASILNRYNGTRLTEQQAAQLHRASSRLQAVATDAPGGERRQALIVAAQVASTAQAGARFDAGGIAGQLASVCDFSQHELQP